METMTFAWLLSDFTSEFSSLKELTVTSRIYLAEIISEDLLWVNKTAPALERITLESGTGVALLEDLPKTTKFASLRFMEDSLNFTVPPYLEHLELSLHSGLPRVSSLRIHSKTNSLKKFILGPGSLNGVFEAPNSIESLHMSGNVISMPFPDFPNLKEFSTLDNISFLQFTSSLTHLSYDTITPLGMSTLPPNLTHLYGGMMLMEDPEVAPESTSRDSKERSPRFSMLQISKRCKFRLDCAPSFRSLAT